MRGLFITAALISMVNAQNLNTVLEQLNHHPSLQAAHDRTEALAEEAKAAEGNLYPKLEAHYSATYLRDKPLMYVPIFPGSGFQSASQNQYFGALKLSYPLFTGFALSGMVEASRLEALKASLEEQDRKRQIQAQAISAYADALAAKSSITAMQDGYDAMLKTKSKTEGLFREGLVAQSELLQIDAALYASKARLIEARNGYAQALLLLSNLAGNTVTDVSDFGTPIIGDPEKLVESALIHRSDILALETEVEKAQSARKIASASLYPTLSAGAQLARHGDAPEINGDGFSNPDRSAVGFELNYTLFDGFEGLHKREASRLGVMGTKHALQAYKDEVATRIRSSYLQMLSLREMLRAADAEVAAQQEHTDLVRAQFDNQLADADLLSRTVAALSDAKGRRESLYTHLNALYLLLMLQSEDGSFEHYLENR